MSAVDKKISYSVVFMGELLTGFQKQQVLNNLVNITRLPIKQIEERFFNKNMVIKKTSDVEKARLYHGKFIRAGMAVGIQMDFGESEE